MLKHINLDQIYIKLDLIGWRVLDLTANPFLDVDAIWRAPTWPHVNLGFMRLTFEFTGCHASKKTFYIPNTKTHIFK